MNPSIVFIKEMVLRYWDIFVFDKLEASSINDHVISRNLDRKRNIFYTKILAVTVFQFKLIHLLRVVQNSLQKEKRNDDTQFQLGNHENIANCKCFSTSAAFY
jgi:hypothetical protein